MNGVVAECAGGTVVAEDPETDGRSLPTRGADGTVEFVGGGGLARVPAGGRLVVPGIDGCWALLEYEGTARRLVAGLKYRNDRRRLAWLAEGMAGLVTPPPGAVVTWVPTTPARRRSRGFDQAELLARAVARRWGVPCRRLLARSATPAQTGRGRQDRLAAGASGAMFRPVRRRPAAQPVVLVDDVVTTGATLSAVARVVRATGAPWIGAVVAARTPGGN